jgi:hypothetical protein
MRYPKARAQGYDSGRSAASESAPEPHSNPSRRIVLVLALGLAMVQAGVFGCRDYALLLPDSSAATVVTIAMSPETLIVGQAGQAMVSAKDAEGNELRGHQPVWSSLAPGVATVSEHGIVAAVGSGSATIRAEVSGFSAFALLTVLEAPIEEAPPLPPPPPAPPSPPPPLPPGGNAPSYVMDFSGLNAYEELMALPGWFGGSSTTAHGTKTIDKSMPSPGGSDRSLLYTYADMTGTSRLCENGGLGSEYRLPPNTTEIWFEIVVKFEAGFRTMVNNDGCAGTGAGPPELKFILNNANHSRFHLMVGSNMAEDEWSWSYAEAPEGNWVFWTKKPFNPFDGKWHTYRFHYRTGSNGVGEFWADGQPLVGHEGRTSIVRNVDMSRAGAILDIMLGATMNQGPDRVQRLWWGNLKIWNAGNPPPWDAEAH